MFRTNQNQEETKIHLTLENGLFLKIEFSKQFQARADKTKTCSLKHLPDKSWEKKTLMEFLLGVLVSVSHAFKCRSETIPTSHTGKREPHWCGLQMYQKAFQPTPKKNNDTHRGSNHPPQFVALFHFLAFLFNSFFLLLLAAFLLCLHKTLLSLLQLQHFSLQVKYRHKRPPTSVQIHRMRRTI